MSDPEHAVMADAGRDGERMPGVRFPLLHDRAALAALCAVDGRSQNTIAQLIGCSPSAVSVMVRRLGIARTSLRRVGLRHHPLLADRDWLVARYVGDGSSQTHIAHVAGCSRRAVRNALVRHGIPLRPDGSGALAYPRLADADWLRAHYQDAGWSLARIAQEVGCSRQTVRSALMRHAIPRRPAGSPPGSPAPRPGSALRGDNTSGYRGVTWVKKRGCWQAQMQVAGTRHFLGYFAAKEDAARAYDDAAVETFGEFARRNLPPQGGN
jgi:lambda repressor-like predicted transcriptional regulator